MSIELDLPPDVKQMALRLSGAPGLAILTSHPAAALRTHDAQYSFLASDPVQVSHELVPGQVASHFLAHPSPRWIGCLPYDALRQIPTKHPPDPGWGKPMWLRYEAVVCIDHHTGRVVLDADDNEAAGRMLERLRRGPEESQPPSVCEFTFDELDAVHEARVRQALAYIADGDIYQVNLARRARFRFQGDALRWFLALALRAQTPYGFFLSHGGRTVLGTSPELGLEVRGQNMRTSPIKGTRPRGAFFQEDERWRNDLANDPKEQAELAMAIDLHRNDLGRVAEIGSVRLVGGPRIVSSPTVHSRLQEIFGRRRHEVSLEAIVRSVAPCGSVTGAPKRRAMEIIDELEDAPRGLYTGLYGYIGRDGNVTLAMAIRTAVLRSAEGEYFAGGGIVAESDPAREVAETYWKSRHLSERFAE